MQLISILHCCMRFIKHNIKTMASLSLLLVHDQSNRQRTKMPNFNYIGGNIRLGRTGASGSNGVGCKQSFSFRCLADLLRMIGFERLRESLSIWWIGYMSERNRFNNVIRACQEDGGGLRCIQDDFVQRSRKLPMPDTKFGELYMEYDVLAIY